MKNSEDLKQKAYFDITIDDKKSGRLVFDLRTDVTPRTVGNFIELCTHEHKFGYKGSGFFRIIPGKLYFSLIEALALDS